MLEILKNEVHTSTGPQGMQSRAHKVGDGWQPSANQGFPPAWGDQLHRETAPRKKLEQAQKR